jgi:tRNA U34 5-methylaminomethyl-2-thiouridine-forming methyltransferase MnmC
VFHSFELNLLEPEEMARALSAWPDLAGRTEELVARMAHQAQGDIELAFSASLKTVRLHVHQGLAHEVMPDVRFSGRRLVS